MVHISHIIRPRRSSDSVASWSISYKYKYWAKESYVVFEHFSNYLCVWSSACTMHCGKTEHRTYAKMPHLPVYSSDNGLKVRLHRMLGVTLRCGAVALSCVV